MPAPIKNPLSPGHIDQLRAAEAELGRISALVSKAEQAGIDVRAERALCAALAKKVGLLLDQFGGGRRER